MSGPFLKQSMQNGAELAVATVFTDSDSYDTVIDSQFTDVAPGATLELRTAYVLADTTSKVEVTFEEAFGDKTGKITVDPSTLSREYGEEAGTGAAILGPAIYCWTGGTATGTAGGS